MEAQSVRLGGDAQLLLVSSTRYVQNTAFKLLLDFSV
jgi:hypothetical protein